ncbi:MAG TPA: hypothetical protein VFL57_12010 [Bryobacteraceae bacterium]|nr:hypothetical protein [Bryobacteraceae bacterium]
MSASRERLEAVLDQEIRRWQAKGYEALVALDDPVSYELDAGFQVEVNVLERMPEYVHVGVAVDDGTFIRACAPVASSVIVRRGSRVEERDSSPVE